MNIYSKQTKGLVDTFMITDYDIFTDSLFSVEYIIKANPATFPGFLID